MRRIIRNSVVMALLVASACVATAWPATSASSSTTDVLQFSATITDYTALPDRGPNAAQRPGDQSFFVAQLSQDGKVVGQSPHHCTAITADSSLCEAVMELADGQVTFQTALSGQNAGSSLDVAITGGTGKYRDARGMLTILIAADGSMTWVVDLD